MGYEKGDCERYGSEPVTASLEHHGDNGECAETDEVAEQDRSVEGVQRDAHGTGDDCRTDQEVGDHQSKCDCRRCSTGSPPADCTYNYEYRCDPDGPSGQVTRYVAFRGDHRGVSHERGDAGHAQEPACHAARRSAAARSIRSL